MCFSFALKPQKDKQNVDVAPLEKFLRTLIWKTFVVSNAVVTHL